MGCDAYNTTECYYYRLRLFLLLEIRVKHRLMSQTTLFDYAMHV